MRRKLLRVGMAWRLLVALVLALCLVPIGSSPAAALSAEDFFQISYEPVEFSETEIQGNEVFNATITVTATCTNDLPLPVTEAQITGCVTATHQASGTKVTLNSSYIVEISPFPQKGETRQIEKTIPLQFPEGSQSGTYTVVGEPTEAKIKVDILNAWVPVPTSYLPPSQTMGSVTYVAPDGGGGGGGGGGDGEGEGVDASTPLGTTYISDSVDWQGIATQSFAVLSVDGKCTLVVNEGTKALTKYGQPLEQVSMVEEVNPTAPPVDTEIIGLTYDLGPDGASFDPPIDLTFAYSWDSIPKGVAEKDLVIAMWDVNGSNWVVLDDCIVNTSIHTITAKIAHFTYFTVLAYTKPAAFTTSALSITPEEVDMGEEVIITALITNTGDLTGSYEATLKIDNVVVATKEVTLAGGASDAVTFKISENVANIYSVNINGLSGSFVVKPAAIPESASTSTPPPKPTNWPVVYGVIAALVAMGSLLFFLARRRHTKSSS